MEAKLIPFRLQALFWVEKCPHTPSERQGQGTLLPTSSQSKDNPVFQRKGPQVTLA